MTLILKETSPKFFFSVKKVLFPSSGFSLIELLIGLSIFAISSLAMATLMAQQFTQIQTMRMIRTRDALKANADMYISSTQIVQASLKSDSFSYASNLGNQTLERCANGNGTATACPVGSSGVFPKCCVAMSSGAQVKHEFNLVDVTDSSATNKRAFSGVTANPSRYDIEGVPCLVASKSCMFQLSSNFSAVCPTASDATCEKADFINTSYTLEPAAGVDSLIGPKMKPIISHPVAVISPGTLAAGGVGGAGGLKGYEVMVHPINGMGDGYNYSRTSYCSIGKKIIGGGCGCDAVFQGPAFWSATSMGWGCSCRSPASPGTQVAYAICAD